MSTNYFDFLDQNSGSTPATSEGVTMKDEFVNLTLRADAECQVTCDGDFLVLLSPNQITKEKAPVGQHILQFISTTHPDIQIEKIVDFPDPGKNYLVLVNEFAGLMKDMASKEQEEEIRRKQEQALREAEMAKVEAERIRAEAEKTKMIEALEAERKREEELKIKKEQEREAKERLRIELSTIDFVEKYTCRDLNSNICIKEEYNVILINEAIEKEIKPAVDCEIASAEYVYFLILNLGKGCLKNDAEACIYLNKSAEHGCREAQNILGVKLQFGDTSMGIEQDSIKAVEWYIKSASQGYYRAQWRLANCYKDGVGVEKNPAEAFKCYRLSANQGDAVSMCDLGWCYETGFGTEPDITEAVRLYKLSAEKGNSVAQNNLANCYYNGNGVEQNNEEAVKWYKSASEQGHCWSQNSLANCYYNGIGVEQNYEEAVKWYEKSAEQGYHWAQCNLANCYRDGKGVGENLDKAIELYVKAIKQGNTNALSQLRSLAYMNALASYKVADCYYYGCGIEKKHDEAFFYYYKSVENGSRDGLNFIKSHAEQGEEFALCYLGKCYLEGCGVESNTAKAIELLEESAEKGCEEAMMTLASHYEFSSYNEAIKWWKKAHEISDSYTAAESLGNMYYMNIKNLAEARKWYVLARQRDCPGAQMWIDWIDEDMNGAGA